MVPPSPLPSRVGSLRVSLGWRQRSKGLARHRQRLQRTLGSRVQKPSAASLPHLPCPVHNSAARQGSTQRNAVILRRSRSLRSPLGTLALLGLKLLSDCLSNKPAFTVMVTFI